MSDKFPEKKNKKGEKSFFIFLNMLAGACVLGALLGLVLSALFAKLFVVVTGAF